MSDLTTVEAIRRELDDGESEAIGLALELKADLLLIDERRGRAVAERLGLRLVGLLGSLIEAKRKGFVLQVKPILDELVETAGFRVSSALYYEVLEAAEERSET